MEHEPIVDDLLWITYKQLLQKMTNFGSQKIKPGSDRGLLGWLVKPQIHGPCRQLWCWAVEQCQSLFSRNQLYNVCGLPAMVHTFSHVLELLYYVLFYLFVFRTPPLGLKWYKINHHVLFLDLLIYLSIFPKLGYCKKWKTYNETWSSEDFHGRSHGCHGSGQVTHAGRAVSAGIRHAYVARPAAAALEKWWFHRRK